MSEFGGGKCPNFGGGKCPPGKLLTISKKVKKIASSFLHFSVMIMMRVSIPRISKKKVLRFSVLK